MDLEHWLFIGTGILLAGVGIPLWRRRIRPNGLYGLRVPATFKDDRVWYEANARFGRELVFTGGAIAVATAVLGALPGPATNTQITGLAAGTAVVALLLAFRGWRHANALWAERQRQGARPQR